jgi:hypothetical protein
VHRINKIAEIILTEYQHKFQKGKSPTNSIFSLHQLIKEHREFNIPTYVAFIDYSKAFDKVT